MLTELIQHKQSDDTHIFAFHQATRMAVDDLTQHLRTLYSTAKPEHPFYIILDMRASGMLPLRYLAYSLRALVSQHPNKPSAYIAVILDDSALVSVTDALLKTILRRDHVQYFTQLDTAQLWLQIERKKAQRQ